METLDAGAVVTDASVTAVGPHLVPTRQVVWGREELRANVSWCALTCVALLGMFLVLRFLPSVGWPLVLASIGSYLLDPVVTSLAARGISRTVCTAAFVAVGGIAVVGGVILGLPAFFEQGTKVPGYLRSAVDAVLSKMVVLGGKDIPTDFQHLLGFGQEHLEAILGRVLPTAGSLLGTILGGSLSALSFLLGALVVPVVGFYLLRGWPQIIARANLLVPPLHRTVVRQRMAEVDRMLGGFIRGQLTMAAVLSVIYSAAMWLIGLKLAVVVGLATGIGNLVPYVGTATGIMLALGFCLVDFNVDYHLALVVVTFVILVASDSIFITPRIVGNRVGLSPASVIVAVLASGSLFGFAGVLLAVPSAAILKLVLRVSVDAYQQSRMYREG